MTTQSDFDGQNVHFTDDTTKETVLPVAPFYFYDDFIGNALNGDIWGTLTAGTATAALPAAGAAILGHLVLSTTAGGGAPHAIASTVEQRFLDLSLAAGVEIRAKFNSAIPTSTGANIIGVNNDDDTDPSNWNVRAVFRAEDPVNTNTNWLIDTDDETNTQTSIDTGVAVDATYHIFRIDFANLADVKFYIDGTRVAGTTTFNMSDLTTDGAVMQPILYMLGTDVGALTSTMHIDYVRLWADRE